MTADEFRKIREASRMAQDELATYLGGVHRRSVQKWEYGERTIPPPVARLMEMLDAKNRKAGRA